MARPDLIRAANDASAAVRSIPAPETPHLRKSGGGGTSDGMGPWEQSVDKQLGRLHADQRELLRFGIGAFVMAFSAIVVSFFLLSAKIEAGTEKLAGKIDALTAQVGSTSERVSRLEGQVSAPKPTP